MEIQILNLKEMTVQEKTAVQELEQKAFGIDDGTDTIEWVAAADWHVLVWSDNLLVGHVEFSLRKITVDGSPIEVGCIGGVCTEPSMRGKGYAKVVLLQAHQFLFDKLQVSHCVLLTGDSQPPFYQKFGYKKIASPCVMRQQAGTVPFEDVVMVLSHREKTWPKGAIDLCGLPF